MSERTPRNLPASVRQRLLNLARERGEDFNALLVLYAVERFLYRLAQSDLADRFILKGAMLFRVWAGDLHRPTRDLDLLGTGEPTPEAVAATVRRILQTTVEDDGLVFDADTIQAEEIRETQEYGGVRIIFQARLDKISITVQLDVGFGDAVVPEARNEDFPTLLDFSPPKLRIYPPETVVAEKLQALTVLGIANSRMKDFYDLLTLSRRFGFKGPILAQAIQATFDRRQTPLPDDLPTGLTETFANHPDKQAQWAAFLNRLQIEDAPTVLPDVVSTLRGFLAPPLQAAVSGTSLDQTWLASGPWTIRSS